MTKQELKLVLASAINEPTRDSVEEAISAMQTYDWPSEPDYWIIEASSVVHKLRDGFGSVDDAQG